MLLALKVKDFAIIDDLEVEFGEGLNVITGETGAGKSIIINALSSLLSRQVSPELVRTGVQQAEVVGHFLLGSDERILKRSISATGRSRGVLNGEPVTLARLEEVGTDLVNIYGQHELHHLLQKESYIAIIDGLLGLDGEREALAASVGRLKQLKGDLLEKRREREGRDKEIGLLEFQVEELRRDCPVEGEEEGIRERLRILKDAEKVQALVDQVRDDLYDREDSVSALMKRAVASLKGFGHLERLAQVRQRTENAWFEVNEVLDDLRAIEKEILYEPEELNSLGDRLTRIQGLKAKYGGNVQAMRDFEYKARERLAYLLGLTSDIDALEKEKAGLEEDVRERAGCLSGLRRAGTRDIEKAIIGELSFLSMKGVRFSISIEEKGEVDETGGDDIDLLISTNPGEALKPLRKVASGGELSRVMLAIKSVIGGDNGRTLIFDEIDAGIGGRVADMVGLRLKELGRRCQIVCITHLPQIAVYGNHHFLVVKHQTETTTRTDIRRLTSGEQVAEIARMLGGAAVTEKTMDRAKEMIENAQKSRA